MQLAASQNSGTHYTLRHRLHTNPSPQKKDVRPPIRHRRSGRARLASRHHFRPHRPCWSVLYRLATTRATPLTRSLVIATAFILLGHIGTLLASVLNVVLPIPGLIAYFHALSSPKSLLVPCALIGAACVVQFYGGSYFNNYNNLFDFTFPDWDWNVWTTKIKKEEEDEDLVVEAEEETHKDPNKDPATDHPQQQQQQHQPSPYLNENLNPYIRRAPRHALLRRTPGAEPEFPYQPRTPCSSSAAASFATARCSTFPGSSRTQHLHQQRQPLAPRW